MELTKEHRQVFIDKLYEFTTKAEFAKSMLIQQRNKNVSMTEFQEVELFILNESISLIKKSLIDNEIDF